MESQQEIVARVNGRPITRFDLDNAIQGYAMEFHRQTMDQLSEEELAKALDYALEKLLARELIYQEALAAGKVADEDAVAEEIAKVAANFPSEEEFFATLQKGGIGRMDYYRMMRQDVTVNQFAASRVEDVPEPEEAELQTAFERFREQMVRPGRVRASHILIRTDDKSAEAAEQLLAELARRSQTENFAELASEHSQCPSAGSGGDLGWFKRGDMVKSFEQAAFSQPLGEVGAPVTTQFGRHLIRVSEREAEAPLDFEAAKPQLRQVLINEARGRQMQEWVAALREKANIEFCFQQ